MPADDFIAVDSTDDSNSDEDDEGSSTYIQFHEWQHPEAYNLACGDGVLRKLLERQGLFSLYADITPHLADLVTQGDRSGMLEWLEPSKEELRDYLESLDEDDSDSE